MDINIEAINVTGERKEHVLLLYSLAKLTRREGGWKESGKGKETFNGNRWWVI